jgi:V/A-type H+/Na+-transporting ATPase subunit D
VGEFMPPHGRIPPGRAGRIWLRRRLATAERGQGQLDRKLRILIPERERLEIQAERRRTEWVDSVREAQTWLLRMTILGGQDAVRNATPSSVAEVEITSNTTMGLTYPADARVLTTSATDTFSGNAAAAPTTAAFRDALLAGARAAAADEAVRRLADEIALCHRRLRALEKRWLPWLREALAALELELEQGEQEDNVRLRRAAGAQPRGGTPP